MGFVFSILEKIAIPTLNLMSTYHERKVSEYNQEPLSGNLDESYIRLLKRLCNLWYVEEQYYIRQAYDFRYKI